MRVLALLLLLTAPSQEKTHKIPPADLKKPVLWGAEAEGADGVALAFGGMDQTSPDGHPGTRLRVNGTWTSISAELKAANPRQAECDKLRAQARVVHRAAARDRAAWFRGDAAATPKQTHADAIRFEQSADALDAEPPPRALSPLAFDATSGLFVLFGGDHLDHLTNDTWVFDPKARRWSRRAPKTAPPPRANHALTAAGGKIYLRGGYTYTSATGYVSGQYRELADGEWVYDVAADAWSGTGVAPDSRVYRTGKLHPDAYLDAPAPVPGEFASFLKELPANTWVETKPPVLPPLNRDWGTAVLDPDRDLILRWSGGHSAHGGTDVLHYHLGTNRWELPFPVEFPLGQLYTNTEYPEGVNFNRRPWPTGHTYQSYAYDAAAKKLIFVGRRDEGHVWDPDVADWTARFAKPKGMAYGDCFYTLTLTPTPRGTACWTNAGKLFFFDAATSAWTEQALSGEKLPGSVVDNSTLAYDPKRKRLLFWRKPYGDKAVYDGRIYAVDLASGATRVLAPGGGELAKWIPYLCQIRRAPAHDLFLVGGTMPPDAEGVRRTPAYDPEADRWISLRIGGTDPSGPKGRNVSLGLMPDAKRGLFWAVDTNSRVYVLRLDPASADPR
jgi:hypothetical protein